MRVVRRSLLLTLVLAGAGTSAARGDSRTWSLCTPGALRSCHSVSIGTVPIYTGAVRTGTLVTITVANLQGSGLPGTGNEPTGLYQVVFTGPVLTPIPVTVAQQTAAMTGAGASGVLNWQRLTVNAVAGGTFAWVEVRGTGASPPLLGGCTPGPTITGSMTAGTCGAGAAAVFAFSIAGSLDASQFDNVWVFAYGARGSAGCYSDPSAVPFFGQACDVLSDPLAMEAIPEPITVVLLGTGLLGLGGVGLRRRRTWRSGGMRPTCTGCPAPPRAASRERGPTG